MQLNQFDMQLLIPILIVSTMIMICCILVIANRLSYTTINTTLYTSIIFSLTIATASYVRAERIDIPEDIMATTKEMKATIDENLGTSEKIKANAHTPLTSEKKLKTYDGKKSFDAQLFCSKQSTFATVNAITNKSGNLVFNSITQDTNADGTIDTVTTPNYEASAICSNGYMYCSNTANPATCKSYKWTTNDKNLIGSTQVPMTELGGCYCINSSCGTNLLFSNNKTVMKDIGSGIAGALSQKDKFFTLAEIKVDGLYAELKGTNTKGCTASDLANIGSSTTININDYKNNPEKLSSDGFTKSGSNVLYEKIVNSGNDVGYKSASCEIKRIINEDKVTLNDIIAFDSGTGGLIPNGDNKLRIILGKVGNNYWKGNCSYFTLDTSFFINHPDRIKKATLDRALFDDWMQIHLINGSNYTHIWNGPFGTWTDPNSNVPGKCELEKSHDISSLGVDFTSAFRTKGQVTFRVRTEVSGEGEGYIQGDIEVDTSCKIRPDTITNTCNAYSENKNCTLLEEVIDGVTTYTNGLPTGLVKLPESVGQFCGAHQIRDWSNIKRRYRCEDNSEWDFEKGFDRANAIKSSIEGEKYGDQIYSDDGTITKTNDEFSLFNGLDAQACEMTCKTEKPRIANDMNLSGVVSNSRTDTDTVDYFYHQCTGEKFDVCPAGGGEKIIKSCGCLNEFGEVAGKIQAIRLAADDMICSDGTEENPDESK